MVRFLAALSISKLHINNNWNRWNLGVICVHLPDPKIEGIQYILTHFIWRNNMLIWPYTPTGVVTVKSVYRHLRNNLCRKDTLGQIWVWMSCGDKLIGSWSVFLKCDISCYGSSQNPWWHRMTFEHGEMLVDHCCPICEKGETTKPIIGFES